MALDPLAQATVPRNNPVSHLTNTSFAQSLMPQQVVIVATLAETVHGTPLSHWSIRRV